MAAFRLQIVTPDRMVFDGMAEKLIVRTVEGDVCILAHHIDYATPLGIGEARVTAEDGTVRTAACHNGLLSVSGNEVRVMATTFEWADEIDAERAERARENAENAVRGMDRTSVGYRVAEAKLKRALIRLQVSR